MDKSNQCPEFPYFGARYPDARCINGQLHDMDNCDENGNLYLTDENNPCPFCNKEEFMKYVDPSEHEIAEEWITKTRARYS